jgi:hypothetical protein
MVVPCGPVSTPEQKKDLVAELIAVLDETKSVDTFGMTVGVLEKMGPKAKAAIPSILRNAERLGILKNHSEEGGRKCERIERLAEILEKITGSTGKPSTSPEPRVSGALGGASIGDAIERKSGEESSEIPAEREKTVFKLSPQKGQKSIKVVIDCSILPDVSTKEDMLEPADLARCLRLQLREKFQKCGVELEIVPIGKVLRAKYTPFPVHEKDLGKYFKTDYVLRLRVTDAHLIREKGFPSTLGYRLSLFEGQEKDDDPVFEDDCEMSLFSREGETNRVFLRRPAVDWGKSVAGRIAIAKKPSGAK